VIVPKKLGCFFPGHVAHVCTSTPAPVHADAGLYTPTLPPAQELPHWNYDGSSTGQAPGNDSEVYLVPRAFYKARGCLYADLVLCSFLAA
jgi:hypothetical protein